jgi:hypothetical protein
MTEHSSGGWVLSHPPVPAVSSSMLLACYASVNVSRVLRMESSDHVLLVATGPFSLVTSQQPSISGHHHLTYPSSPPSPACCCCCPQVGQEGFEATAGTLGTYELAGHTDSVVALGFNHAGRCVAPLPACLPACRPACLPACLPAPCTQAAVDECTWAWLMRVCVLGMGGVDNHG